MDAKKEKFIEKLKKNLIKNLAKKIYSENWQILLCQAKSLKTEFFSVLKRKKDTIGL